MNTMNSSSNTSTQYAHMEVEEMEKYFSQGSYVQPVNSSSILECHVNSFAANDPIEDRYNLETTSNDFFCGVFDGHGGFAAAEFARTQLIQYVQYNLYQKLQAQLNFSKNNTELMNHISQFSTISDWDQFSAQQQNQVGNVKNTIDIVRETFDPSRAIPDAMKKAFLQADQAFLLSGVLDKVNKLQDVFSGACLLLTYIVENWVFVANAGDCKAVLGKKIGNRYIAVPLSVMHTARSEQEQIMKQHPNEPDAVLQGRIKGFLEPSRGLGDALFKDKYFNKCLLPEAQVPEPFSPPYTTALPDVTAYQIDCTEDKDCFLILATDGLWDMMSDQQAVDVVAESLQTGENSGTALLKKSLEATNFEGNSVYDKMNSSFRLSSKLRRHFYDDTTTTVIFFKPNTNTTVNKLPKIPEQCEKPPVSFVHITEQLQDFLPPNNSSPT